MRPRVVVLLAALGCSSEVKWGGGTGVGNPGTTKVGTSASENVTLRAGQGTLDALAVVRCSGREDATEVGEVVDLLGSDPYSVEGGRWCGLTATFAPPIEIDGAAGDGLDPQAGTFRLVLGVDRIELAIAPEIQVDRDDFVLELGHWDWIPADLLGLAPETEVVVDEGHPLYDPLVRAIVDGSALYLDADGDGELSSAERRDPVAAGSAWRHDVEDDL
jgi:hypothetical protein